jgi:hypothetical protein
MPINIGVVMRRGNLLRSPRIAGSVAAVGRVATYVRPLCNELDHEQVLHSK